MADLEVDTAVLREAGAALRETALGLDGERLRVEAVAGAVGDEVLAARLLDASRCWDSRRAQLLEEIAYLTDAAEGVGDTFEEIETELVAALRGQG